jgi:putative nucleotidyltransferase with HDIG domain
MNPAENLRQVLKNPGSLPTLPIVAQKILSQNKANDEDQRALIASIGKDPAVLTGILNLCNSHLAGSGRKIQNIEDAVTLLGRKQILMLALALAIISTLPRKPPGLLNAQSLWKHSLAVAMTMDTLSHYMPEGLRPSQDEICLAGLLHDYGFLVLDYFTPELSDKLHARLAAEPKLPMEKVEEEMLGTSHSELGAILARHWNLPEHVITSMSHHHAPDENPDEVDRTLVAMVNLAELLIPTFGFSESAELKDIAAERWQALGIDSKWVNKIRAKVQTIVQEVATTRL